MITGVLHFSFTVSDLDRSVDWYTSVVGFSLVHRQRQDNAYTRSLVGMPTAVLDIAQLALPGITTGPSTHVLELVEYKAPEGRGPRRVPTNDVCAAHLALLVTDIHERYERMRSAGAEFRNPPVLITEGANQGGYACYFWDPDGITLELLQQAR